MKFSNKKIKFIFLRNKSVITVGILVALIITTGLIRYAGNTYLNSSAATCTPTLQTLINNAAPGSTILVPACIYRESVKITKSIILDGQGKAEIRGSDIWTGWTKQGNYWVKGSTPNFVNDINHCADEDRGGVSQSDPRTKSTCKLREQVFLDGKELLQVNLNPKPGEFSITSNHEVQLANDPAGHTVEVTVRSRWVEGGANNVTIKNFIMKHSAVPAQDGALTNNGYTNWTIENNILTNANGANLRITDATGGKIINNEISYAGQLGLSGNRSPGLLIKGNRIHHNNTLHFSCGWECGALKVAHAVDNILEDNDVYQNYGYGLWCDIECSNTTFRRNRVHDNENKGIVQEISGSAKIYDNVVWNNGFIYTVWGWGSGILSQNSDNVEIYNNIVAWNADGAGLIAQASRTSNPVASNNSIHDNTIIQNTGYALFSLGDGLGSGNTSTNNKIYTQGTATVEWNSGYTKITKTDAENILSKAGVPLSPGVLITPSISTTVTQTTVPATTIPTISPTKSPTPTVTKTPTPTLTLTPTITVTPTSTPLPTVTISASPTPVCSLKGTGDATCDGQIDLLDFETFRTEYLAFNRKELDITTAKADFNSDKSIDLLDFEIFRTGYISSRITQQ